MHTLRKFRLVKEGTVKKIKLVRKISTESKATAAGNVFALPIASLTCN